MSNDSWEGSQDLDQVRDGLRMKSLENSFLASHCGWTDVAVRHKNA